MVDSTREALAAMRMLNSPATRELVPALEGYSARWHVHDFPGPYCRWNYHPEFEIHLIQRSVGRFVVGDCIDGFAPGQLTLIGSNLPHNWISDHEPGQLIKDRDVVFQFHPHWVAGVQQVMPEFRAIEPLLRRSDLGLEFDQQTAEAGAAQMLAIGESTGLERLQCIFSLLALLAAADPSTTRTLANPWAPRPQGTGSADAVDVVMDYINSSEEVTQSGAAALVGMSESTFSRYFSRRVGQSFTDTVRKMRLARARQLLATTDLPIAGIATRSGYRNLSNFNRQFNLVYDQTPREYRQQAGVNA